MILIKKVKVKRHPLYARQTIENDPHQNFFWSLTPQGFHKVAYVEWGDKENPCVLVCVHGLTRNSRDFDYLAKTLQKDYRIVCPDLLGRGKSDYIDNPHLYNFPQYMNDMVTLLARISTRDVHWLGTSLGGIIGMMLAAQPNSPIKSLILNDIGMVVPSMALRRLGTYARNDPSFPGLAEAKNYFQTILAPFGIQDTEKWDHIAEHGTHKDESGAFRLTYDPAIGQIYVSEATPSLHLETYWQAIHCPLLVLRGEESDFLLPDVITKMLYFQPSAEIITIPGCGHAPSLMEPSQIQIIEKWLREQTNTQ